MKWEIIDNRKHSAIYTLSCCLGAVWTFIGVT